MSTINCFGEIKKNTEAEITDTIGGQPATTDKGPSWAQDLVKLCLFKR